MLNIFIQSKGIYNYIKVSKDYREEYDKDSQGYFGGVALFSDNHDNHINSYLYF